MLDVMAQPEDEFADVSDDEFDAMLIHDYLAWRMQNPKGLGDPGPPHSARQGEYLYAHENPAAWELLDLTDLDVTIAQARGILGVGPEKRHMLGKHDQQTHGRRGGLRHPTPSEAADLQRAVSPPEGGFTMSAATGDSPTTGYVVSPYPERSRIKAAREITAEDIRNYATDNRDMLAKPDHYLGGWHDSESGNVFLDVAIVKQDRATAIMIGQRTNQISIFDLNTGNTIPTGGTGEA